MNRIFLISLALFIFSFQFGYSQDPQIPEGAIMIDENTIIKDESGNKVEMSKLMELMNSGEWMMDPVNDSDGKLLFMQLRKATEEEKKMLSKMPKNGKSSDLIGKNVPAFEIEDINGNIISSEDTKGKVVVLNFWFTSCKPCISEIPELNEVYEEFRENKDVVFASITFNELDNVNSFLKKYPLRYPVVADAKEICDLFQIVGYPTNIIIDRNGDYFDYLTGGSLNIGHQISNSIQNALDGRNQVLSSTHSVNRMIDPKSTFKLENGNIIPFNEVIDMLNSNKYDIEPKEDENNKEYFVLKRKK